MKIPWIDIICLFISGIAAGFTIGIYMKNLTMTNALTGLIIAFIGGVMFGFGLRGLVEGKK